MRVEPFAGDDDVLRRLVTDWSFKPYHWADVPEQAIDALALSRIRESVGRQNVWTVVTRSDRGEIGGLATLEWLSWDSRMLDTSAARVELIVPGSYASRRAACETLIEAVSSEARARRQRHLSVRVDTGDVAAIHALEASGWLSVDALLTFERPLSHSSKGAVASETTLRAATLTDAPAVESIAAESFVDGRFHADPSIAPDVATAIYREWAAACCRGDAADEVLVAESAGQIVGFVACRMLADTGVHLHRLTASIVLIATTSLARGRGVGGALVNAALESGARRSAMMMQVGTQIRNPAAARLYEHYGFRLASGSQSFRAVITQ